MSGCGRSSTNRLSARDGDARGATTARRFSGPDALRFGIVEAVASEDDVLAHALVVAESPATPRSHRHSDVHKRLIHGAEATFLGFALLRRPLSTCGLSKICRLRASQTCRWFDYRRCMHIDVYRSCSLKEKRDVLNAFWRTNVETTTADRGGGGAVRLLHRHLLS